jgi:hypothetical protein
MKNEFETEKQLANTLYNLQNEIGKLQSQNRTLIIKMNMMQDDIDKKPNLQIEKTIVQTDPAVMPTLKKISNRLAALENVKPKIKTKETIIKEIEKPTIIQKTLIQTDPAVIPTLKKLSTRLKILEDNKPDLQLVKEFAIHQFKISASESKKEIEEIKNTTSKIMPILNKLKSGVSSNDVLELIKKHVILSYINKLYGK